MRKAFLLFAVLILSGCAGRRLMREAMEGCPDPGSRACREQIGCGNKTDKQCIDYLKWRTRGGR